MVPLLVRHEIQVLLRAGHTPADTARRAGVSVKTVRRVAEEDAVTDVDDAAAHRGRGIGRPSKAAPFAEQVAAWLAEKPDLPTQELLRRAVEAGYTGHKTAFYALVAGMRPLQDAPVVRFEGLPGEFSQHDFGQVDVWFVDGRKKRIRFFASRLKYSRYVVVELVVNERVETIVRCLARHFVKFEGLTLMAVFDRPRTIVLKSGRGREVEAFNATFAQAIVDIGVGVEMCAPRSGKQKGSVEHLVKWVKNAFFKHRKFVDEADLEAQLAAWQIEVNTKTPSRATGEIPETRRQQELSRLRPIKVFPENLVLRLPVFVGPTAEVQFEGVTYSMPPQAVNMPATLFLHEKQLRIVTAGARFEAMHRRRTKEEPPAPLPEHRSAKIAAVHGKRAKLYAKRQSLLDLGPAALTLLTEITHRDKKLASRRVEELYELLERHGDDALRAAITSAVDKGRLFVSAVRHGLEIGARERRGERPAFRGAQPRGEQRPAAPRRSGRAERKRGAS
ncbi:MAG TPA: IS21 family transposase [Vicinamibacterales bacterium]|nr:IS21 family transposase [Vicinamibacterales bacterium]